MSSNALKSEIRLVFNDKPAASSAAQASCLAMNPTSVPTTQIYQNNNNNNNNNNNINKCSNINEYRASNELEITQTSNLLDSILDAELTNLNIQIDNTSSNMYNNNNSNTNINSNNSGGSGGMFHPTWDEWKQRAQLSNENTSKCKHESVSSQHTNTFNKHQQQHHRQQDYNRMLETNTTKSNLYKQEEIYTSNSKREDKKTVYSNKPSSPVLIRNANTNQLEYVNESALRRQEGRSPRHYPVAGIDFLPVRAPSPVELSSCTLAKQPPLDLKTEQEAKQAPKPARPEPQPDTKPLVVESAHQQRKIKTILSTRKESAPNLTGWRTESDSDSDAQNRLLARASGSIPIEYISIRRDPKPHHAVDTNAKKSITTGTNTSSDRGKRIAATNTNQDELPQYNLHVSLDSLLVKSRQEASTATDVKNKTVSTETSHVGHKDAGTLTDAERSPSPPQPPKPQEQLVYTQRRSRYTEWQSPPAPAQTTYRLEMLTQSPRPKQIYHHHHHHQEHHHHSFDRTSQPTKTSVNYSLNQTIRVDDDDRLIFGHNSSSRYDNRSHEYFTRRSGSFPCLVSFDSCANNNSTHRQRYVRHTQTSNYSPFVVKRVEQVHVNRPEFELGVMPLIGGEFAEFNDKFRQIFGQAAGANTRRYYKYSRTSTDNGLQCVRQATEMPHVSSSFGRQVYQQQHNVNSGRSTVPIVEIPVTPTSTIGKSSHCYTANGPVITSMSRNASATNLNSSFSMSSTQQQQHKSSSSFEPVVRRVSSAARATDLHESISEQRQFRPINETVSRETHFRSSSSNGQPVPVIGQVNASRTNSFSSSNAASSSSARQNFSSSYQYSSSSKNIN